MTNAKVHEGFRVDKKVEEHWSNLQTQHIVTPQSHSCVAKRNSTVMAIITIKTL